VNLVIKNLPLTCRDLNYKGEWLHTFKLKDGSLFTSVIDVHLVSDQSLVYMWSESLGVIGEPFRRKDQAIKALEESRQAIAQIQIEMRF
jgi:hypothetical protein